MRYKSEEKFIIKKNKIYCFFEKLYNVLIISIKIFNKINRLKIKRLTANYLIIYYIRFYPAYKLEYAHLYVLFRVLSDAFHKVVNIVQKACNRIVERICGKKLAY